MLPHWGPITIRRLWERVGRNIEEAFSLSEKELTAIPGVGPQLSRVLSRWHDYCDLNSELQLIEKWDAWSLHWEDETYPPDLRSIADAPVFLYGLGRPPPFPPGIGIVGTRYPSRYGVKVTRQFSSGLAAAGCTIFSGLARGVDAEAHDACLESGGFTVGVLGSGMNQFYPPECRELFGRIAEEGTVLSEYPMDRVADRQTFPIRNRIVSGLSKGVLVVESKARGGSLITAEFAGRQGRQVYAVPGRIDQPLSGGCHQLIRDGAQLVTLPEEIMEDLQAGEQLPLFPEMERGQDDKMECIPPSRIENLSDSALVILKCLAEGDCLSVDDLALQTQFSPGVLISELIQLELKDLVSRNLEGRYESC